MVHGGGRGNEQALTAAKESGLRSPVRASTFNFPHHRFRITANCIIIAQILHFSLLFLGAVLKSPLIRVIFNRKLGDYHAIRSSSSWEGGREEWFESRCGVALRGVYIIDIL